MNAETTNETVQICSTPDCGEPAVASEWGTRRCFFCDELEMNRRRRQLHGIGEYAPEKEDK